MKTELFRISSSDDLVLRVVPQPAFAGGYGSFESPAKDFPDDSIDLLKHLIRDKDITFLARVSGNCLIERGIFNNDILIIEKGIEPKNNDVVAFYLNGDFYIKVFKPIYNETARLEYLRMKVENPLYEDMYITSDEEFILWGVATKNIHNLR